VTRFRHGAATATGGVRPVNEDSYLAKSPLYAVADGMGGHGSGDVASSLAIGALTTCLNFADLSVDAVLATLDDANRVIRDAAAQRNVTEGMGTTVAGLAAIQTGGGSHLMVFNIGDSRVYRFAAGRLDQVTVDHSEVEELVLAGTLTRDQARNDPRRNVITRALGLELAPLADRWLVPANAGDRYLLCSDGLFNELSDDQIASLLTGTDPEQAAAALVAAADEAGGHDNITAVVVDVIGDEDEDAEADTMPRDELPGRP
jgi:serine/threonine protein phosphatase PrpC